ncbi:MAG: GNAT family N-acetyltransferase [Bdellovibrio sp.]|nr:GNAT family N-acetyltransferase [Bdellovibrio sp.]
MQGPRTPESHELKQVVDFLNSNLRQDNKWPITSEYPTALSQSNIHNMSIICEDEKIIAHAVLKTLVIKTPIAIFKVGAIGSVVTDPDHRHLGYSTKNIEKCIELAKEQECDVVVLWTDQFDFYRKMGFELAGYDYSYVIENETPIKNKDLRFVTGNNVDPAALQKLYSQHTVHALRTNEDFKQFLKIPNSNLYTAWDKQNQIVAYAVEGKGLDLINYVHEWAGQTPALIDLFNYIHQQKKQTLTVMTPAHSKNLHQQLGAQAAMTHQGYLGMLKLINKTQLLVKIKKAFRAEGLDLIVFEEQNGKIVFGYGMDLYTLDNEADLIQILFGPLDIHALDFMSAEAKEKLSKLLPMPLWIWGWDSI